MLSHNVQLTNLKIGQENDVLSVTADGDGVYGSKSVEEEDESFNFFLLRIKYFCKKQGISRLYHK